MRVPKLCRHKAKSRAYVTIDGAPVYLGPWPEGMKSPSAEVVAKYKLLVGRTMLGQSPAPMADGRVTIAELVGHYMDFLKKESTHHEYMTFRGVCVPLLAMMPDEPADDFGPNKLRRVREWLLANPVERKIRVKVSEREAAKGGGMIPVYESQLRTTPRTRSGINISLNRVRRIFRWAVSREMIPGSVVAALETVEPLNRGKSAPEAPPRLSVSDEMIVATLPHLSPVLQAMVRVQRLCGARPIEICRMTTGEIDRSDPECWMYSPTKHKGAWRGKGKEIPLGPAAIEVVRPWLRADPAKPIFCPLERKEAERVWNITAPMRQGSRRPGAMYTTGSYGRAILVACKKGDVPRWSPNQIRKTVANQVADWGSVELAQALLGHSDPETTKRFYLQQNRRLQKDAASRMR